MRRGGLQCVLILQVRDDVGFGLVVAPTEEENEE